MSEQVATVERITRYPVKSMAGEELETARLTFQGMPFDRQWAFVQAGSRAAFPWLTGRELAELVLFRARFDAEGRTALVETPAGETFAVTAEELHRLLEERTGRPLFLMRDHRGNHDIAQVSLIAAGTVARIAAESGTPPEPGRFRANFYLRTPGDEPFAEDAWVGRFLRLGDEARVAITEPDDRCAMVTIDPHTAETNPAVLRAVAQAHGNKAGVYGVVLAPGVVRQGDPVIVE